MTSPRVRRYAALLACLALGLQLLIAARQSLWADELFSLAMATGHSLEQPAAAARPELGDFVQGSGPAPAAAWRRYLEFQSPPAGPGRVVRAVELSDTSPPLYYLLLSGWLRITGTGDLALRLFSILWALATIPLLWSLAREVGGDEGALAALALYAVSPMMLYYGTEARMYSLLWFLAAAAAWLALRLHREGPRPWLVAGWIAVAAAGLLTHYFFVFPLAGAGLWLLLRPGRCSRMITLVTAAIVTVLVLPWYLEVPRTLAAWRVTGDWLAGRPSVFRLLAAPLSLLAGPVAVPGVWSAPAAIYPVIMVLVLLLIGAAIARRALPPATPPVALLGLSLFAAVLGPVVFDLLRHSSTSQITRYALGGAPAMLALTGAVLTRLSRRLALGWVALLVLAWAPVLALFLWGTARSGEPFAAAADRAMEQLTPGGLVVVHGIPSSVVGIARYLPPDTPVAAWVEQLGERRVPDDIERLAAGYPGLVVLRIHHVGSLLPEVDWLDQHAQPLGVWKVQMARLFFYRPVAGPVFTRR